MVPAPGLPGATPTPGPLTPGLGTPSPNPLGAPPPSPMP
jgi:hypothetical protein